MRFYLSSYKFGDDFSVFRKMLGENLRMAYIPNAMDCYDDLPARTRDMDAIRRMEGRFDSEGLDIEIELIDLREYFGNERDLEQKLEEFGIIWVRGGNVYVLQKAIEKSGFDNILRRWRRENRDILYAGYSAGVCILAKNLEGIHLMDDLSQDIYGDLKVKTEGIGLLDYLIIPHVDSPGHPETELADVCIEYMNGKQLAFETLSDGEVIVIDS